MPDKLFTQALKKGDVVSAIDRTIHQADGIKKEIHDLKTDLAAGQTEIERLAAEARAKAESLYL